MEDVIGGASAATLGFISGGIKGAGAAYGLYSNFARRRKEGMAPLPRPASKTSQKRKSTSDPGFKTVKRMGIGKSRGKVKRVSTARAGNNNQLVKANSEKGYSARKKGLKKPVKVPRKLRKQIKKVLETEAVVGKHLAIHYFAFTPGVPFQTPSPNDENTFEFVGYPGVTGALGSAENRLLFSPQYVRYCVSRLCGGLAAQQVLNWAQLDTNETIDAKIARIRVIKQSATYRLRNNTGRTVTIRIMCWSPKSVDYSNEVGSNPYDVWTKALNDQSAPFQQNPTGTTVWTLYNSPKYLQQMKNMYAMDETIVDVPAGKEYIYKVDGPQMEYDFSKYWKDGKFYDMQRFVKQVSFVACNDLTKTSLNKWGRYTDNTIASSGGVVVEQTCYVKFAIPEQVGFKYPTNQEAGVNQSLEMKRYVFGIDNFQGAQTGVVSYIGDENPQQLGQANN